MMLSMAGFLDKPISTMLQSAPFTDWRFEKLDDGNFEERRSYYRFEGHGLEVEVDRDDTIICIFLYAKDYGGFDETLMGLPFSSTRTHVLKHFGKPSKSGKESISPYLGKRGAWDRFDNPKLGLHAQYQTDSDSIKRVTLILNSVIPR